MIVTQHGFLNSFKKKFLQALHNLPLFKVDTHRQDVNAILTTIYNLWLALLSFGAQLKLVTAPSVVNGFW